MSNKFATAPGDAEIMAPVGSDASLVAAIEAGADSIYFGVTRRAIYGCANR